ncbi:hypothetical protein D3C78_1769800 [compost metagenome]
MLFFTQLCGINIVALLGLAFLDRHENVAVLKVFQQATATLYQAVGEQFNFRPQLLDAAFQYVPFIGMPVQRHIKVVDHRRLNTQGGIIDLPLDFYQRAG